jgi:hypothetical protein
MFRFVRAAGYAVAALFMAGSAAFADPSQAYEVEAAPVTSSLAEHAAANLDGSDLALNTAEGAAVLAHDTHFSAPVVEHAIARDEAAPAKEFSAVRRPLHAMVPDFASADVPDAELECLAGAIYFESKGEPLEGQLAVAEVILNRARSGRFPPSICGVVKQRGQFSFVRGGRIPAVQRSSEAWRKAVAIAHIAQKDLADSAGADAMFFHARYVSPRWRLKRIAAVGNHIFYR